MGLLLNIDSKLYEACKTAADEAMTAICGSTNDCTSPTNPWGEDFGTESLRTEKDEKSGDFTIMGLTNFAGARVVDKEASEGEKSLYKYAIEFPATITDSSDPPQAKVLQMIEQGRQGVKNKIEMKLAELTNDKKIKECTEGKNMGQITSDGGTTTARFPNLTDTYMLAIIQSGLQVAAQNYAKQFNKLVKEISEKADDETKARMCAAKADVNFSTTDTEIEYGACPNNPNYQTCVLSTQVRADRDGYIRSGTEYSLSGISKNKKDTDMAKAGNEQRNKFYVTDPKSGSMLGTLTMASTWDATSKTCTVTKTEEHCESASAVYNESSSRSSGGGCILFICGGGSSSSYSKTFAGTVCNKMSAPETTNESYPM
jgi:hypothetical protein